MGFSFSVSSMAMPRISSPCDEYFLCKFSSHGISVLQGSHQVAQKLIRTAFPRNAESWIDLPSGRLRKVKSGAMEPVGGSPAEGGGEPVPAASGGFEARFPSSSKAVIPTTMQRTTMTFRFTTISYQVKRFKKPR